MKVKLMLAAIVLAALLTPIGWAQPDIAASVLRVTSGPNVCSSFVIDGERGYVMSALHCKTGSVEDLRVSEQPIKLAFADKLRDILVMQTSVGDVKALRPGPDPQQEDTVKAYGYGYGQVVPMLLTGIVALAEATQPNFIGKWTIYAFPVVQGMSGGPIVNTDGQVVGVVQASNEITSISRLGSDIYSVTKQYWEYGLPQ